MLVSEWGRPDRAIKAGFHNRFLPGFGGAGLTSLFRKQSGFGMGFGGGGGFSFFDPEGLGNIMEFVNEFGERYNATRKAGYICMFSGNHDTAPRLGLNRSFQDLKLAFAFLLSMPGVPKSYYGDEIGMVGVPAFPQKKVATCATEVARRCSGARKRTRFSTAAPEKLYLPVEPDLDHRTVTDQENDPESLLNAIRALTEIRLAHPALWNRSDYQVVYARPGRYPFAFLRQAEGETILVAVNPADRSSEIDLPADALPQGLESATALWASRRPGSDRRRVENRAPGVGGGIYLLA